MRLGAGRPPKKAEVLSTRSATITDINAPRGTSPAIKRIRESHHRVARLAAMGLRPGEIAAATGYSLVRISILLRDPTMQEQIHQYRSAVDDAYVAEATDYYSTVNKARDISARMILDQLVAIDDGDEELPIRTLTTLHGDLADRTGYGKRSTQLNVNIDFAAQLDKAIKRSEMKDVTPADSRPSLSRDEVPGASGPEPVLTSSAPAQPLRRRA